MNTADVYKILYLLLGFYAVVVSYWLTAAGLAPRLVQRCAETYGARPWKTLLVGLLTAGPLTFLGIALASRPNPGIKVVGTGMILLLVLIGLIGSAGLAVRIGEGLKAEIDERSPWRRVLRGGLVLGLTFNFPILGWLLVMPAALLSGFGAVVVSRREPAVALATASAPAPVPEAPAIPERP